MVKLNDSFYSHEIAIECPHCGAKLQKSLRWLKANPNFSCTCGSEFNAGEIGKSIRSAEKQLQALSKKLSKPINIKLKL